MVVTDNLQQKARLLGLALVAPILIGVGGISSIVQAASPPASASTAAASAASALQAVIENDFSLSGGQVVTTLNASALTATLNLSLDGMPLPIVVNAETAIQVGPYGADRGFLLAGASVKVWFHLDTNGDAVADLIVITPTTVKGTLVSDQNLNAQDPSKGQLLTVAVPQADGSTKQASVEVLPATVVKILPPWDASQGLGAAAQVAAVGVMNSQGALVAAIVVGVVSQG